MDRSTKIQLSKLLDSMNKEISDLKAEVERLRKSPEPKEEVKEEEPKEIHRYKLKQKHLDELTTGDFTKITFTVRGCTVKDYLCILLALAETELYGEPLPCGYVKFTLGNDKITALIQSYLVKRVD